jgi:hypothetical protein
MVPHAEPRMPAARVNSVSPPSLPETATMWVGPVTTVIAQEDRQYSRAIRPTHT